ncbi:hypothetical protein JTE90_023094 [Oedothorax gibbosus]|uniref:Uncharacterized protein n=1 Tax=Oedothorax gibbosus TaxID=931172 RepID=A0AAV6UWQ3_9ARAC|nr:hypothetical protein JTE90_023094 [Oedothorax gibbosus]
MLSSLICKKLISIILKNVAREISAASTENLQQVKNIMGWAKSEDEACPPKTSDSALLNTLEEIKKQILHYGVTFVSSSPNPFRWDFSPRK